MKTYYNQPRLARNYSPSVDEYEFAMGDGFNYLGKSQQMAVFDVFFRKIPNDGGYVVMAGLDQIIPYIESLKFDDDAIQYFTDFNYPKEYIEVLKKFKFHGSIYAVPDGTPVFPHEPILTVVAPLGEINIIEGAILSILNGAMEHATAARRVIEAAPKNCEVYVIPKEGKYSPNNYVDVSEFGLRRSPCLESGINEAIYGIMAGCVGTSNVHAAMMAGEKAFGTFAHLWVQAFPTELDAFKYFAVRNPHKCILLIDTFDILESGLPNAIATFKYMQENGYSVDNIGVRLDSGDLSHYAKKVREALDAAGFPQAKIFLTNDLKPETIESLNTQNTPYDCLGVGTYFANSDLGPIGCVYKMVAIEENNIWVPKIKISQDPAKTTNPGYKKLYRAYDKETGYAIADIITEANKIPARDNMVLVSPQNTQRRSIITNYDLVELQKPIFINGELVYDDPELRVKRDFCCQQMATLDPRVKRLLNPQEYFVDATEDYINFKEDTIKKVKKLIYPGSK